MASERSVDTYYADVKNMPLLTAVLERDLFTAYRTCAGCGRTFTEGAAQARCPDCHAPRNLQARERLVRGALRFVVKMARDYAKRAKGERHGEELLLALISAGNLGLLVAVDRFSMAVGTRFLTYAAWWVREKILEELDSMGVVRVPAYRQKAQRSRWKQSTGDVEAPAVTLTTLDDLDRCVGDSRQETDLLNRHGAGTVSRVLRDAGLSIRDRYILTLHLGIREDPKSLRQISLRVGYSPERTRLIRREALDTLRGALDDAWVDDVSDVFA